MMPDQQPSNNNSNSKVSLIDTTKGDLPPYPNKIEFGSYLDERKGEEIVVDKDDNSNNRFQWNKDIFNSSSSDKSDFHQKSSSIPLSGSNKPLIEPKKESSIYPVKGDEAKFGINYLQSNDYSRLESKGSLVESVIRESIYSTSDKNKNFDDSIIEQSIFSIDKKIEHPKNIVKENDDKSIKETLLEIKKESNNEPQFQWNQDFVIKPNNNVFLYPPDPLKLQSTVSLIESKKSSFYSIKSDQSKIEPAADNDKKTVKKSVSNDNFFDWGDDFVDDVDIEKQTREIDVISTKSTAIESVISPINNYLHFDWNSNQNFEHEENEEDQIFHVSSNENNYETKIDEKKDTNIQNEAIKKDIQSTTEDTSYQYETDQQFDQYQPADHEEDFLKEIGNQESMEKTANEYHPEAEFDFFTTSFEEDNNGESDGDQDDNSSVSTSPEDQLLDESLDHEITNLASPADLIKILKKKLHNFRNQPLSTSHHFKDDKDDIWRAHIKYISLCRLKHGVISWKGFEALVWVGSYYFGEALFEQARVHCEHAKGMLGRLEGRGGQRGLKACCELFCNLGRLDLNAQLIDVGKGRIEKAEEYFKIVEDVDKKLNKEFRNSKAALNGALGNVDSAIEEYLQTFPKTRALGDADSLDDSLEKIENFTKIAELLFSKDNFELALAEYVKIINICNTLQTPDKVKIGSIYAQMTLICLKAFSTIFTINREKFAGLGVDYAKKTVAIFKTSYNLKSKQVFHALTNLWKAQLNAHNLQEATDTINLLISLSPIAGKNSLNSIEYIDLMIKKALMFALFGESEKSLKLIYQICTAKKMAGVVTKSPTLQLKLGHTLKEALKSDGLKTLTNVKKSDNDLLVDDDLDISEIPKLFEGTVAARFLSAHNDFRETFNMLLGLLEDKNTERTGETSRSLGEKKEGDSHHGAMKKSSSKLFKLAVVVDKRPKWQYP